MALNRRISFLIFVVSLPEKSITARDLLLLEMVVIDEGYCSTNKLNQQNHSDETINTTGILVTMHSATNTSG